MVDLAPCPFCGGEAIVRLKMLCVFARCEACEAEGPLCGNVVVAASRWNTRQREGVAIAALEEIRDTHATIKGGFLHAAKRIVMQALSTLQAEAGHGTSGGGA
jgi:hypothetical protein